MRISRTKSLGYYVVNNPSSTVMPSLAPLKNPARYHQAEPSPLRYMQCVWATRSSSYHWVRLNPKLWTRLRHQMTYHQKAYWLSYGCWTSSWDSKICILSNLNKWGTSGDPYHAWSCIICSSNLAWKNTLHHCTSKNLCHPVWFYSEQTWTSMHPWKNLWDHSSSSHQMWYQ